MTSPDEVRGSVDERKLEEERDRLARRVQELEEQVEHLGGGVSDEVLWTSGVIKGRRYRVMADGCLEVRYADEERSWSAPEWVLYSYLDSTLKRILMQLARQTEVRDE